MEKGEGYKGKGKGKGIKGACWTCNEIGHRAEDCPKKKTDLNPIVEGSEQDHDWEEDSFGDEDCGFIAGNPAVTSRTAPAGGVRFGIVPDCTQTYFHHGPVESYRP